MPISHKYKCLFIHIPKTGGTSIETALGMFSNWKIEDKNNLFGLIQSTTLRQLSHNYKSNFLQHLTYEQCQTITPTPENYLSFSFIRNPWDKIVSTYSNLDNNLLKTALSQGIDLRELSFKEFITTIKDINHIHLEPQYKFIYNQKEELCIDFIGKFESLTLDFNRLCQQLDTKIELPNKNKSQHKPYRTYYSEKTKKAIAKIYEKDIDLFKYHF